MKKTNKGYKPGVPITPTEPGPFRPLSKPGGPQPPEDPWWWPKLNDPIGGP